MKKIIRNLFCMAVVTVLFFSTNSTALKTTQEKNNLDNQFTNTNFLYNETEDLDPLVDLVITITIKEIRAFDRIDLLNEPDFYVKLIVNDQSYSSNVWHDQKVVYDQWQETINVPDEKEYVNITIKLWDWNIGIDTLCDIAKNDNDNPDRYDITVHYSLKTGHWFGDDSNEGPESPWQPDYSGYGHANGCDDNSIYENDKDCEIWFDITQNDYDGDGIPYWTEVNVYGTDPTVDDRGRDDDGDLVPIEWEFKWGYRYRPYYHGYIEQEWLYDPFTYNNHSELDPDSDSLNNVEEYLTSEWGSDPFRKDIFVELDQMAAGPNGEAASILPEGAKELLFKAFNRQNIVFHLDDGRWEDSKSDIIPFDELTEGDRYAPKNELIEIYEQYFLNNSNSNWRAGVFHYGVVLYQCDIAKGNAFRSNSFQISSKGMKLKTKNLFTGNRDIVYATSYMHELGHTLNLNYLLGHSPDATHPWQPLWWKARPYKSIMNYGYMYGIIFKNFCDYSNGQHGKNDFDDWSNIDFSYFDQFK